MCAAVCMNAGPRVSVGSLGEGGFGFFSGVVCVCVEKRGTQSLGDKGRRCIL